MHPMYWAITVAHCAERFKKYHLPLILLKDRDSEYCCCHACFADSVTEAEEVKPPPPVARKKPDRDVESGAGSWLRPCVVAEVWCQTLVTLGLSFFARITGIIIATVPSRRESFEWWVLYVHTW